MSRSIFALKFRETVGTSAMEYLTRWRMMLAWDQLANFSDPISVIRPVARLRIRKRLQESLQRSQGLFTAAVWSAAIWLPLQIPGRKPPTPIVSNLSWVDMRRCPTVPQSFATRDNNYSFGVLPGREGLRPFPSMFTLVPTSAPAVTNQSVARRRLPNTNLVIVGSRLLPDCRRFVQDAKLIVDALFQNAL